VPDAPELSLEAGELRALLARLRAVIKAKDTEIAVLREQHRLLELRIGELERRLGQDSTTSGTPPSKDTIGARERCKAGRAKEKKQRQASERERREDRKRGGQPGHPGAGLSRDPDPARREEVPPPAECAGCGASLEGAGRTGSRWSQVWDVKITRFVTGYLLPLLACPCCGEVSAAQPPAGAYPGSISCGPQVNTAAVDGRSRTPGEHGDKPGSGEACPDGRVEQHVPAAAADFLMAP
jgi:transposase